MSAITDPITLYERKVAELRRRLKGTFIVFINAPDVVQNNQGYFLCGSHQDPERDEFENFDSYTVGQTETDIRDVRETLDFWDAEERGEHAPNGKDYHAIVAAKALSGYQRDILRDANLPLALAAETAFFDTLTEIIVLHADGELERLDLDRTPVVRFLAGDDDPELRTRVTVAVSTALGASSPPGPDDIVRVQSAVTALGVVKYTRLFALGQLCPEPGRDDEDD